MARFTDESKQRVREAADITRSFSACSDRRHRGKDWWGCPSTMRTALPSRSTRWTSSTTASRGPAATSSGSSRRRRGWASSRRSSCWRSATACWSGTPRTRAQRRRGASGRGSWSCSSGPRSSTSSTWRARSARRCGARAYLAERGQGPCRKELAGWRRTAGRGAAGRPDRGVQGRGAVRGGAAAQQAGGPMTTSASADHVPIRDQRGGCSASVRAQRPEEKAKYVNPPRASCTARATTLYGIDQQTRLQREAQHRPEGAHGRDRAAPGGGDADRRDHGDGDHARVVAGAGSACGHGGAGAGRRPSGRRRDDPRAASGG